MLKAIINNLVSRDLRWFAAIGSFAFGRGLNFAVLLITLPLVLGYLGPDRFGIWVAASSLIALFNLLEGGIGSGLLLSVPQEWGEHKLQNLRIQFSSAFFLLASIGTALLGAYLAIGPLVGWSSILKTQGIATNRELFFVIGAVWCGFSLNFPVSFLRHFRLGLQEGAQAGNWEMATSASSLAGIALAVWLDLGLVGISVGATLIPALLRWVHFLLFIRGRKIFGPAISAVSGGSIRSLLRQGLPMWGISISVTSVTQANIWLLASRSSLAEASTYGVGQRYFMLSIVPASVVFGTFLPSLIEAISRGETRWAKQRFYSVSAISIVAGWGLITGMAIFAPLLMSLWIGNGVTIGETLTALIAVHAALLLVQTAISTALLSLGTVDEQAIVSALYFVICFGAAWIVAPIYGAIGVAGSTLIAFVTCLMLPHAYMLHRRMLIRRSSLRG